ncbi:MAG: hypothetical protein EOP58_13565, partial [Sphingomonadales bacterium]
MTGAAVIAALGLGFGAAQLMKPSAALQADDGDAGAGGLIGRKGDDGAVRFCLVMTVFGMSLGGRGG